MGMSMSNVAREKLLWGSLIIAILLVLFSCLAGCAARGSQPPHFGAPPQFDAAKNRFVCLDEPRYQYDFERGKCVRQP
jgi:hypothetical protein